MQPTQKITACVFLHKDGKLFVAKRAATKDFLPGKYELPGGHIEFGETLQQGLQREFREEFNFEIKIDRPFHAFTYLRDGNHIVEIDYFAELADPDVQIKLNPEDHSEYKWVGSAELDSVFDPNDDEYKACVAGFEILNSMLKK